MKMHRKGILLLLLTALALCGCAVMPKGPSVMVLPGPGKSFDQFQNEDMVCRNWATQSIGSSPQEIANRGTATGAVVGTAVGAAAGALIGGASGDAGTGAAIGAGTGLLFGAASGAESGTAYGMSAQRRYDVAYMQCMYAKGNQIPGVTRSRTRRRPPPPPPSSFRGQPPPQYYPAPPPR